MGSPVKGEFNGISEQSLQDFPDFMYLKPVLPDNTGGIVMMLRGRKICNMILAVVMSLMMGMTAYAAEDGGIDINWGEAVLVNNIPQFTDAGADARGERPGTFGSQFPRMLIMKNNVWLSAYTIYRNNGYISDINGGNELQISRSMDGGKSWEDISIISDPGRDLDNAQMLQLDNGDILLACRSVIWYQSYRLDVYKSSDNGVTWSLWSTIDEISGEPGELRNPDRGVYEPFMVQIDADTVGVMYASEKYAKATPAYSQILVLKTSVDNGKSWSDEIWTVYDTEHSNARPGMPVWAKMKNGEFILVYEIVGTTDVDVFYKISTDGINWPGGMGTQIQDQKGAPYVLALRSGELVVTSNTHKISVSKNNGNVWTTQNDAPYGSLFGEDDNLWPSLYETDEGDIIILTSAGRAAAGYKNNGHNIQMRKGYINKTFHGPLDGAYFKLMSRNSEKYLDVSEGSMAENANVQIWDENGAKPEEWHFISVEDGYYKIISANSGLALTVDGTMAGSNVVQSTWRDTDEQKWKPVSAGSGFYKIVSKIGDLCLDVSEGKTDAGTNVQVWNDNQLEPQQWQLEVISGVRLGTEYMLMAKHSGKFAEVENGSLIEGANVQQSERCDDAWQEWTFTMDSVGFYTLTNANSRMCLDVDAGSVLDGANIQQWPSNNLNPQKWGVVSVSKGYYSIIARNSGKCLDVDAGKKEDGANIQQWEYNGLDPQLWKIVLK